MNQEESNIERLTRIADDISSHLDRIDKLYKPQIIDVARYGKNNRKLIWGLVLSLVFDMVLTFFLVNNAIKVDNVTKRLDVAQSVQRQGALCPLYQIFLDSKSSEARKRAVDPQKYDEAFEVIQDGYNKLKCNEVSNLTTPSLRPTD